MGGSIAIRCCTSGKVKCIGRTVDYIVDVQSCPRELGSWSYVVGRSYLSRSATGTLRSAWIAELAMHDTSMLLVPLAVEMEGA